MSAVTCLRHFGIVVRDLDTALAFYEGLLGLIPGPAAHEGGAALDAILGMPGIRVTTVKMRAETGETLLELLHFTNPPVMPSAAASRVFYRQGPTHIALTVSNLPALLETLKTAGCDITAPAQASADGKVLVTFCRDYEGNLLELVQPAGQEKHHVA